MKMMLADGLFDLWSTLFEVDLQGGNRVWLPQHGEKV